MHGVCVCVYVCVCVCVSTAQLYSMHFVIIHNSLFIFITGNL